VSLTSPLPKNIFPGNGRWRQIKVPSPLSLTRLIWIPQKDLKDTLDGFEKGVNFTL
jgi:hypothetical protein